MNTRCISYAALCAFTVLSASALLHAGDTCCATEKSASPLRGMVALPETSLYHFDTAWRDQHDRTVTLADFAGAPVIVSMVFTHCAYACPRIVADLRQIEAALPADVRGKVRFVLASFDTARDTPERLRAWAEEQNLGVNWTLLHGDANTVRELSVLLDIPYVAQPDGGFGHGNRIVLLDPQGVPTAALEGLGARPEPISQAATSLVRNNPSS